MLKRRAVMARAQGRCERCLSSAATDVHHLTYIRRYHEALEDLQALCRPCHDFISAVSDVDPLNTLMPTAVTAVKPARDLRQEIYTFGDQLARAKGELVAYRQYIEIDIYDDKRILDMPPCACECACDGIDAEIEAAIRDQQDLLRQIDSGIERIDEQLNSMRYALAELNHAAEPL